MRRIRLTRGKWATVDDRFYAKLVAMGSWYFNGNYAVRNITTKTGRKTVYMHKLVARLAGIQLTGIVDHRSGRMLDNRVKNLRAATRAENNRNSRSRRHNTSGYRGVIWHHGRWNAQIKVNRKNIFLGTFQSKTAAARAYDRAAIRHGGRFARTNFAVAI